MVADVLPVSPPGVGVAVVAGSAVVVSLVWVVTSAVAVVTFSNGTLVVLEVVGVVDRDVWRELVFSAEDEVAGVVVMGSTLLPVACVVSFESRVEFGVELLGIVVPLFSMSRLLVCELVGPKVNMSAEEKASRQHARVTKVAAMVLL